MLVKHHQRVSNCCQYYLRMNKKFGAGKLPTGTPSLGLSCVVVIISLLSVASIVHNIYKPDLRLPAVENVDAGNKDEVQAQKQ